MHPGSVLQALRAAGKPATAKIYRRHGVRDETFGVPYAALEQLVRRLGTDHDLALALWKTGVHDARVLATKLACPERMTREQIDGWRDGCTSQLVADALAALAARMPDALDLAEAWSRSASDVVGAAGWTVYAILATAGATDPALARRLLPRIERGIARATNRTRHAMNNALIAIGGGIDELREAALSVARSIGRVEVDHGDTDCKTPDAAAYIERMAARAAAKRTRVAAAKVRPPAKASQAAKPSKPPRTKAAKPSKPSRTKAAARPPARKAAPARAARKKAARATAGAAKRAPRGRG